MASINATTSSGIVATADNTGQLQLQSAGTTAATFNTFGIGLGTATPSSGIGITFPATQSASSDANTLDDYEEGTWTPTDASGASLSLSNTSGNCFYTKIGRVVIACFRFTYPSTANGSFATIGGLPFTSASATVSIQGGFFVEQTYTAGAMINTIQNTTTGYILNTSGVATNANVSAKDFRGVFVYQTA